MEVSKIFFLIILFFVFRGLFVASIGPPWYAEDEPSHFGYMDALERTGKWFLFETNHSSMDTRIAHRYWDIATFPDVNQSVLSNESLGLYEQYASSHQNATAYQAPLYYWLSGRLLAQIDTVSIVDQLYIMRYVNVLVGVVYMGVLILTIRFWTEDELIQVALVGTIGLLPLLGLMSASVTLHVWVMLLFAIVFYAYTRAGRNPTWHIVSVGMIWIGLYTQQLFWFLGVAYFLAIVYDWRRKLITNRFLIGLVGMLLVGVLFAGEELMHRHSLTSYTVLADTNLRDYGYLGYMVTERNRIVKELVWGVWDQNRSMVLYQASMSVKAGLMVLTFGGLYGLIGLVLGSYTRLVRHREFVFGMILSFGLLVGLVWFDLQNMLHTGQAYIKARYFFVLLPMIGYGMLLGLGTLGNARVRIGLYWFGILLMALAGFTSMTWLWVHL